MTNAPRWSGAAALLLTFALASPAAADDEGEAELRGANENPIVISAGSGEFEAEIEKNEIEFELSYDVAAGASDILQAHIHIANPWDNGPVVVYLCSNLGNTPAGATQRDCPPSPGEVEGEIVAGDVLGVAGLAAGDLKGLARLIEDGATYVNVHTNAVPSGEVRGQINPRER